MLSPRRGEGSKVGRLTAMPGSLASGSGRWETARLTCPALGERAVSSPPPILGGAER